LPIPKELDASSVGIKVVLHSAVGTLQCHTRQFFPPFPPDSLSRPSLQVSSPAQTTMHQPLLGACRDSFDFPTADDASVKSLED